MPTIKDLLSVPIGVPKSIEASLPSGLPKVSTLMANALAALPALPALPAGMPTMPAAVPRFPKVTEFIRSVETVLPTALPKFPVPGQGGAASEVKPASRKAPELVFE